MTHDLKTWPEFFRRVRSGQKNFEVRKNDRDFQVGDTLVLLEYNPVSNRYEGNEIHKVISYVLHGGQFGIEQGYCVLGLSDSQD
jgi:hypothetical protein